MAELKKISEWFEQLPEKIKIRAIKNTPEWNKLTDQPSLKSAISIAFDWGSSPEGWDYWNQVLLFGSIKPNNFILILDIETTHASPNHGKIVEIGIVELDLSNGEKQIIFDEMTHEDGITASEVQNCWIIANSDMTVKDVQMSTNLRKLRPRVQAIFDFYPGGCTAFNNKFDFGYTESRGFSYQKKLPCPMLIAKPIVKALNKNGGIKNPNVNEAYQHFFPNTTYIEKHRGADDAFHEGDIVYELYKMGEFKLD